MLFRSIGPVGGYDYEMYKQPVNYTSGVNPFAPQAGGSGGISRREGGESYEGQNDILEIGANKAQGYQNGLGGTNNPVDPVTGEKCRVWIG